jgi:hypothetical protein
MKASMAKQTAAGGNNESIRLAASAYQWRSVKSAAKQCGENSAEMAEMAKSENVAWASGSANGVRRYDSLAKTIWQTGAGEWLLESGSMKTRHQSISAAERIMKAAAKINGGRSGENNG